MSLLEVSKERARSKALILQKLATNYQKSDSSLVNSSSSKDNEAFSHKRSLSYNSTVDESVSLLESICGHSSDRYREYFRENLLNKSIIVENLSNKAAKASSKTRRERQQKRWSRMSHRKMKRFSMLQYSKFQYSLSEVRILFSTFSQYLSQLLCSNSSQTSLQTKLSACELVGAEVYILDATVQWKSLTGETGVIVAQTENLVYFINSKELCSNEKTTDENEPFRNDSQQGPERKPKNSARLQRLDRSDFNFLILLPNRDEMEGESSEISFPTPQMLEFLQSIQQTRRIQSAVLFEQAPCCELADDPKSNDFISFLKPHIERADDSNEKGKSSPKSDELAVSPLIEGNYRVAVVRGSHLAEP